MIAVPLPLPPSPSPPPSHCPFSWPQRNEIRDNKNHTKEMDPGLHTYHLS